METMFPLKKERLAEATTRYAARSSFNLGPSECQQPIQDAGNGISLDLTDAIAEFIKYAKKFGAGKYANSHAAINTTNNGSGSKNK